MHFAATVLIFITAILAAVRGLPQGAPTGACQTMMPFHGGGIPRQNDPSPYEIYTLRREGGVFVVVKSGLELPFEGFMLQARTPDRELVGSFEPSADDAHTNDCNHTGDTLTHSDTRKRSALQVQWHPNGYEGPVIFNATVAQDYSTFWSGIESKPIQISKRAGDDDIVPPSTKVKTTTPPYFQPEQKSESSTDFDPFYSDCNVKKSCFGVPSGCVASKNCKAITAITVKGDQYIFEVKAIENPAWVAVGLSQDAVMGDDSVMECVKEDPNIRAYMSWTSPRPKLGVNRLSNPQQGIQLLSSNFNDGSLYCQIQRDVKTTVNGVEFDLQNNKYYLLVATGSFIEANKVGFHDKAYAPSGEAINLADVSLIMAASKLLLRLHGAFMLAAWIGTASVGMLLARYYRQTWVGRQMCGKDLWFAWHRLFMCLTWALTTAGFVLIFVELKAWSSESNPHAYLGVATTVLCFLQPIGAYFRPHPGTKRRPIFNWLHWFGGNCAHILAIVTIFFAVKLNKAELPEWFDWILVAFVVFHVITHLALSILGCASEKSAERRITSFPMKDLGGSGRTSSYADRNSDAPFSGVRKWFLAIYIIVIILLLVALIFNTVIAPVDEFWNSISEKMSKTSSTP